MQPIHRGSEIQEAVDTLRPFGSKPDWLTQDTIQVIASSVSTKGPTAEQDQLIATKLRNWYMTLNDHFTHASNDLHADLSALDPEEFEGPDGVAYDSLRAAELECIPTLKDLNAMRESFLFVVKYIRTRNAV